MGPGVPGTGPDAALRPYQAEAVQAIVSGLGKGGRGQVRAACGTGKTLIAARASGILAGPGGVIVVLVPSIALAAQTIGAWRAGCAVDQVIAVCSDYTVGGGGVRMRAADLSAPVSTDPELVAKWLADASGRVLVVGTYDSAHRLAEALRRAGQVAELTICDEAHRLAGPAGKVTAAVLAPGMLPERRRLYLTATPRIGTGVTSGGELVMASMDDEAIFGPVLYTYSFGRGIAEGYLKGYRIVVAGVTDSQLGDLLDGGREVIGEGGVPVRMAAAQAALAMTAAQLGLRRCVAFLPRVAQARQFATTLPATLRLLPPGRRPGGPLAAGFVHGDMTSQQRDLVLDRLRHPPEEGWAVVANARCLSEGVDVPAIDSVLFAAPKTSVIDIVQAVGRALRRHDDAETATIIVPALLPGPGHDDAGAGGPENAGRYEHVLRVVRALCAHDETLTASLGAARAARASAPAARPQLPAQVIVEAPPGTVARTLDALKLHIVDGTTAAWWDGYGQARAYHAAHGGLRVPVSYVTGSGFRLGAWLTRQRVLRNSGQLADDRITALDQLGMVWDVLDEAWMATYSEARAYHNEHGHLEIPEDHRTATGISLATWLANQRAAAREGRLPAERAALLEAIGFGCDPAEARWKRRFSELTQAIKQHGGPRRVPAGSAEGIWLENQRVMHRAGRLPADKIALLEQAGVALDRESLWQASYQALRDFHARHGHFQVPDGEQSPHGIDLRSWMTSQRTRRNQGQLAQSKIRLLEQIGFPWDPRQQAWQARYAEARAFKAQHGHLEPARGTPLHAWLYQQKKKHRTGQLPGGQTRALRDLGVLPSDTAPDGGPGT